MNVGGFPYRVIPHSCVVFAFRGRFEHWIKTSVELHWVGLDLWRFEFHPMLRKWNAAELTVRIMRVGPRLEELAVICCPRGSEG